MVKKKIPAETYFGEKKIPANSNAEKKKFILRRNCPPATLSTPTKISWSVPKSIQKQIVEYDIKSKCPEKYSTVNKVGSEKLLASKSCFVWNKSPPHFCSNL